MLKNWRDWKFFKWGFFGNTWIWFHMLGGGVGAFILLPFMAALKILLTMLVITLLWEVYEFIKEGGFAGVKKVYGSVERWFYDSLGDVIGAMLISLLVALAPLVV